MKKILLLLLFSILLPKTYAQEYFPNNESIPNKNTNFTAFTNAKIYVTPTQVIEKGTLLIQNGKVIAAGATVVIPKNCTTINLEGKSIYPSFIDMYTSFGIEKPKGMGSNERNPLYVTKKSGHYWNENIKSEVNGYESFKYDQPKAEELLKAGFGVVGTHVQDGIARGSGTLIALNNFDKSSQLITDRVTNHYAFTRSATTNQAYPSSLMGMMALLRQMYLDLDWYKKGNATNKDITLEAVANNEKLVQIFASEDKLNSLRAAKIGKEFGLNYILKGNGNEFERIEEIKKTNSKFIIPINFPEAYDVSDPNQANQMELKDLRFWNQAPTNLKVLVDNGVVFALTTDKLKKLEDFRPNLLKAIKYGFDKTKALEALTTIPASILGKSNEIGSLKTGSLANFIIASGEIFDDKTILYENWVQGNKFVINDIAIRDIRGDYDLTINSEKYKWKIDGDVVRHTGHFDGDFAHDIVRADRLDHGLAIFERHHVTGCINLNDTRWLGRVLHGSRVIAKLTAGVDPRREKLLPPVTASQQDALPLGIRLQPKLRQLARITESLGRSREGRTRATGQDGQREETRRQWKTTERSIVHGQFLMPWGQRTGWSFTGAATI